METHRESLRARLARLGIAPGELKESFRRSSGPGGQHVNKVETGVVIEHPPTGLRAIAEDSRSRERNRLLALERLVEAFEKQRAQKRAERLAAISKMRRQKAKRSRATKAKLVETKRRRGETKKLRKHIPDS